MNNPLEVQTRKAELRRKILARLPSLQGERRAEASVAIAERLDRDPRWMQAHTVLGFAPMALEVDVWPILIRALNEGKAVALPRFDRTKQAYSSCFITHPVRDVQVGRFGIFEPTPHCSLADSKLLDFTLVPGIGFDVQGRRLGRGKGFYDMLLQRSAGVKCGICFDEQVLDDIPVEPHDVRMDCIITPTRLIDPRA